MVTARARGDTFYILHSHFFKTNNLHGISKDSIQFVSSRRRILKSKKPRLNIDDSMIGHTMIENEIDKSKILVANWS